MTTLPLEGIRVTDLSRVFAMPYFTAFLADLGAEVIKVEGLQFLGADTRLGGPFGGPFPDNIPGELHWERNGVFHTLNRGKRSITLDLNVPDGLEALRRLVLVSDVIVENFTPRIMKRFNMDYPNLRQLRPDIIMLSNTGYGHTGPFANYGGMAAALEPTHGTGAFMGYRGGPPNKFANSYTDFLMSWTAIFAIMSALLYRARTGRGLWIDVAMYQGGVSFLGEGLLDYAFNGRTERRLGNRHEYYAPHNTYPCRGKDRWIAIAVTNDEEWHALCQVLGKPEMSHDPRFADPVERWKHQDELDDIIAAWTSGLDHYEAAYRLQAAGVPAGPVLDSRGLLTDPHMRARGFFDWIEHPPETGVGRRPQLGRPWRFSSSQVPTPRPGPRLGEANSFILQELLGFTQADMGRMKEQNIIGNAPLGGRISQAIPIEKQLELERLADYDPDYRQRLGIDGASTA